MLLKRLAVGGMAELFLARDTRNNALVVLKRILPYLSHEEEFVQMFLDEARIAAQLHHPNIIRVHELGKLSESIFIAMEFVEGADLRKLLQEEMKHQRPVPYALAAYVIAQVCAGLYYAHHRIGLDGKALGIIHRDVSPQNVMVGLTGEVKLVDFGIAKAGALVERSKPGVIKGKFLYLSPEQLSQERIDHRSDLFAVGTMLYEVTTGKSPFFRTTSEAVIYSIRAEEPAPPHLVRADYPPALSRIVAKCLVKDRTRRYQEALEIQADLEAFLRTEQLPAAAEVGAYVARLLGREEERKAEEPNTLTARPEDLVRAFDVMMRTLDQTPGGTVRPLDGTAPPTELVGRNAPVLEALPTEKSSRDDVPTREIRETALTGPSSADSLTDLEATDKGAVSLARGRRLAAKKPLVMGGLAFAVALLSGLVLVWALSGKSAPPKPAPSVRIETPAEEASPPSMVAEASTPIIEEVRPAEVDAGPPVHLSDSVSRVTVLFKAPAKTRIQDASGRERIAPNVRVNLLPGTKKVLYRCPARKGKKGKLLNLAFEVRAPRDGSPQVIYLCRKKGR